MSDVTSDTPRGIAAPSRRDLLIGGMMAAAAGISYWREPHNRIASIAPGQLDAVVPLNFADWHYQQASGVVLPPPDQLAQLIYDQQCVRTYFSANEPSVMMVMAYGSGQNGAIQMHRPEICYPAGGFRLSKALEDQLPLGNGHSVPIRCFTATSDTRVEQVLYWSRIANHMPTGWWPQRVAIMEENLKGFIPDGLLFRVSVISTHRDQSMELLKRFCRQVLAASGPKGRERLLGSVYAKDAAPV